MEVEVEVEEEEEEVVVVGGMWLGPPAKPTTTRTVCQRGLASSLVA